jgi:hypothetical protein
MNMPAGCSMRQDHGGDVRFNATDNSLALLSGEQAHRQSVLALLQAQATRLGDTAALFQALGGGWWNLPDNLTGVVSVERTQAGLIHPPPAGVKQSGHATLAYEPQAGVH